MARPQAPPKADFFDKIKLMFSHPRELFKAVKDEKFWPAFSFLLLITLIPAGISFFYGVLTISIFSKSALGSPVVSFGLPGFLFVASVVGFLFSAALFHIFVWLLGGRRGWRQTFKVAVYGASPGIFMAAISPLIGLFSSIPAAFAQIYSAILLVIGLEELQELTRFKAILAVILPIVLAAGFAIVLLLIFLGYIRSVIV
jgi:hypothetical protein